MLELVVYCLAAYGLSWIIAESKISYPFRLAVSEIPHWSGAWLLALLECVGCLGVHVGYTAYLLGAAPKVMHDWWVCALFTAASNLLIERALRESTPKA